MDAYNDDVALAMGLQSVVSRKEWDLARLSLEKMINDLQKKAS